MTPTVELIIIIYVTSLLCWTPTGVHSAYVTVTSIANPETLSAHKVKLWKSSSQKPTSSHKPTPAVVRQKSTTNSQKPSLKKQKVSLSSKKPRTPPAPLAEDTLAPSLSTPCQRRPQPTYYRRLPDDNDAKKTSVRGVQGVQGPSFGVEMIRPFGTSTIRYVYTELRSPSVTPQLVHVTRPDQAHSVSVLPYDCDNGDSGAESGDRQNGWRRKKRRRRRKKLVVGDSAVNDNRATNTILPLPNSLPIDDPRSRGAVFKVPADQLNLLYTVRESTVGYTTSTVKADEQDESVSDALNEDYDYKPESHETVHNI